MFARIEITPQRNAREKDEAREQLALDSITGFVYTGSSPKSIISGRIPARDTTMPVLPRSAPRESWKYFSGAFRHFPSTKSSTSLSRPSLFVFICHHNVAPQCKQRATENYYQPATCDLIHYRLDSVRRNDSHVGQLQTRTKSTISGSFRNEIKENSSHFKVFFFFCISVNNTV